MICVSYKSFNCRTQWQYASIYNNSNSASQLRFRNVYLMLDEGTLTFNSEPDVKKVREDGFPNIFIYLCSITGHEILHFQGIVKR